MMRARRGSWIAVVLLGIGTLSEAGPAAQEPPAVSRGDGKEAASGRTPVVPPRPTPPAPGLEPAGAAATPTIILYQGRLTDPGGAPRTGSVTLVFGLYAVATGGSPLWTETHNLVPLTDGTFSVLMGSLTAFPNNAWSDPERYLGVSVDGAAELTPRLRVASVPYAIEANRLNGKKSTDFDPAGSADFAAAGVQASLQQNDQDPPNVGSNQVHWNNLWGVPPDFADGIDNVGAGVTVHSQLQGLDANDHPQYVLGAALQSSDGNPPNLGSNRVHWDNLGGVPQPLASQLLPGSWIAAGAIDSTKLAVASVRSQALAPGAVQAADVAAGAIGSAQVADNSLTGDDIQNNSLTGDDIANGSLTGLDIQDETITTSDIQNGTILGADMSPGAVGTAQLSDGAVTGAKILDGSVGPGKLADESISGAKLAAGAVGGRELAAGAVTADKVADGALSSSKLADGPGVGFINIPGFVDTVGSTYGETITSVTIQAPGPGYAVVNGGAQIFLLHDLGMMSRVWIALSTVPDVMPDSTQAAIGLPGNYPTELYLFPVMVQTVFAVPAAGPITFYLTARKGTQNRNPSLHDVRVQATFIPRAY